jgi:AcrR family transcriptional regulator
MAATKQKKRAKAKPRPRYGDKRPAILDAALRLFAANGAGATTVPMIADAANVAVGTLYCHFPSKEALANHLVEESCQAFCAHLWEGFPHEASFRQQFGFYWRRCLSFALERPEAYTFLHQRAKDLDLSAGAKKAMRELEETENWILDRGAAAGQLAPLPKAALSAMMHGAAKALLQAHFGGAIKLDDILVNQTEESCWAAVRVDSAPTPPWAGREGAQHGHFAKNLSAPTEGADGKI